jgi:AcrR family transcriptional regulator
MAMRATSATRRAKEKKMTSRQLQALRTKDNIYESALKVIGELGYENTSIEAITTAAGVSMGSFYTYFTSKENVLLHSYVRSEIVYQQAFEQASHVIFPENLYIFIQISYSELEQRGKEIMYGVTSNMLSADFKARVNDRERLFFKCLHTLIESGKQTEKLSENFNTGNCVDKIFIMLTGVEVQWCLSDFNGDLSALAVDAIRTLVNGVFFESSANFS